MTTAVRIVVAVGVFVATLILLIAYGPDEEVF
ncbi:membrane protein [Gordonia phage Upyo]|nr:membrane protein [Gordonia phage Upyo]